MIFLLAIGIYMSETETYILYGIHKSIGLIILIFALYRVFVRVKEGWPKPVGTVSTLQQLLSKTVHFGLIITTLLFPASGILMSIAGGYGAAIFGLPFIPANIDPNSGEAIAISPALNTLGHNIHEQLTWILIPLITIHVIGALKHHYIDKDETIKRMFSLRDSV